jgi:putative SOS response-associated peptidase YedK
MTVEVDEEGSADLLPRYNVSPSQSVAAIRHADGRRTLARLRWGLIPSWAKDPKIDYQCINARAETVATKPAFRSAFKRRRCLIPADGFLEWQKLSAKKKQPYHIRLRDESVFTFAGLWECWHPPEGEPVETCTIVTTEANDLVRPLHDRMPVILDGGDRDAWLAPDAEAVLLQPLLRPFPAELMEAVAVSTLVNSPKNDLPECLEPLAP